VNEPVSEPALSPLQNMTALPIVALPAASARLPLTVAFDIVPFPVGSPPLLPGPAANAEVGASRAAVAIAATTSHPNLRPILERRRIREVCIFKVPERGGTPR
jgi:hypothetical protein